MEYYEEIKKAMEAKRMSLQDVVNDLKQKHQITTSPQNIHKYVKGAVKRPDSYVLQCIFDVLEIPKSKLPNYKGDSGDDVTNGNGFWEKRAKDLEKKLEDEHVKYVQALEEIRNLSSRLITGSKNS